MLSLIGGIFILLGAVVVMWLVSFMSAFLSFLPFMSGAADVLTLYGIIGIVFALLVIAGGVMLLVKPDQHVVWGIVVLLFSLFSIISTGGFIIGMILGIVGGVLGIVWKPSMAPMAPPPMTPPQ